MQTGHTLVHFFKGLGDEKRLRLVHLLAQQEYNVGDLAQLLELSEPTTSHHLSKLREIGLVNLRADANKRFYSLNEAKLQQMKEAVNNLEYVSFDAPKNDTSWVNDLDMAEWERNVLRNYTFNGKLKQIPTRDKKKLLVILRWLASHFEQNRDYTEAQVNEIILRFHSDKSGLRRDLIIYGFLDREKDGSRYWVPL